MVVTVMTIIKMYLKSIQKCYKIKIEDITLSQRKLVLVLLHPHLTIRYISSRVSPARVSEINTEPTVTSESSSPSTSNWVTTITLFIHWVSISVTPIHRVLINSSTTISA